MKLLGTLFEINLFQAQIYIFHHQVLTIIIVNMINIDIKFDINIHIVV